MLYGCKAARHTRLLVAVLKSRIFVPVCDLLSYKYQDLLMLPVSPQCILIRIHFLDLQRNSEFPWQLGSCKNWVLKLTCGGATPVPTNYRTGSLALVSWFPHLTSGNNSTSHTQGWSGLHESYKGLTRTSDSAVGAL